MRIPECIANFLQIFCKAKNFKQMKRFILFLISFAALNSCTHEDVSVKRDSDPLIPVDLANIKVGGEIGRRIDITIENNLLLLNIDNDFLASFREKNDKGYIGVGKLIDGAVKMAAYTEDERIISLKNRLTDEIIKAQEDDGYIGNKSPGNRMWKLWDIHEMGYIINGLITNYKLFNDNQSLIAAEKAADYIIDRWSSKPAEWGKTTGVSEHVAITGIHRTMLTLYTVTNDKRYLDFCLNQLDLTNLDPGIIIGRRELIEGHIYGYMAACLAQLELYRINPDEKLLVPTMKALNFMTSKNGMTISGGAGQAEIWTDDQDGRCDLGESCATVYQLRVYDNLLRLRNDSRFGDIMERTIYNALFGAQSPDGRQIRYFTPLEGNRVYHDGDTYCCPCNYRRFISELPAMVYYRAGNGVAINLYTTSAVDIVLDGGNKVNVRQETDYPNSGHVIININPSKTSTFPLKLRIPSWCKDASISVNGSHSDIICKSGTFAVIERLWETGDQVVLEMPMQWRLVLGRQRQAGRVALMRGPLLFCLDPDQNESLAKTDGADLGRIVIDMESVEPTPLMNDAVRPDGIACRLKAGNIPMALGNRRNLTLIFTEFADPDGKCTYFRVPDLSEAVPDELYGLW
jgi:DUF1680 family protein